MYPVEETFGGDYVEFIHYLTKLNRRYLLVAGKSTAEFDEFMKSDFMSTLKFIKASENEREYESNLNLLYEHFDDKVASILIGKGTMHERLDRVYEELGKIRAEQKAKENWAVPRINPREIDELSESILGSEKRHKFCMGQLSNTISIVKDKAKLAEMVKASGVKPEEFITRIKGVCEKYKADLQEAREKNLNLILDYNQMLFESMNIEKINEIRLGKKRVSTKEQTA